MMEARERAEVIARNDATFRASNERINDVAQTVDDYQATPLPFLCECADLRCTEIVRLTGTEYERLRRDPTMFATVHGHEGDDGATRVLEENDRYAMVQKVGRAADVAAALDPRTRDGA